MDARDLRSAARSTGVLPGRKAESGKPASDSSTGCNHDVLVGTCRNTTGSEFLVAKNGFREGRGSVCVADSSIKALPKFLREMKSLSQGERHCFLNNLLR